MAQGKFRLYYVDANGVEQPASNVQYRILQEPEHQPVGAGKTDLMGMTGIVDTAPNYLPYSQASNLIYPIFRPLPVELKFPLAGAPKELGFQLEVWDHELGTYVEPTLHSKHNGSKQLTIQSDPKAHDISNCALRLQPYLRVRFQMQKDRAPISGAPYQAFMRDAEGREVPGRDARGRTVRGVTTKEGSTQRIPCDAELALSFVLPGTSKVGRRTEMLQPLIQGRSEYLYILEMKSQIATTAPNEGRTAELNGKISAPAILNADGEELILLTPDVWEEFEALAGNIENTMAGLHRARAGLENALMGRSAEDVKAAEKELGIAEDNVATLLNKKFGKLADLKEVVTFESYDKGRFSGNGGLSDRIGLRRRYIPAAKYEELKKKRIMGVPIHVETKVSAEVKDGPASAKSSAEHESGKKPFDAKKFKESLGEITTSLKKKKDWDAGTKIANLIDVGGNQFADTVQKSEGYETESAAQWLRFVGGAGASAEATWDPKKGSVKAQLSGQAEAKLVLFEGKWVHRWSIPSIKGWQMQFSGVDLGAIVFVLAIDLYGFAGAKASVCGTAGISYEGGKAKVTPQKRDRSDSLATAFDTARGLPRAVLDAQPAALNESAPKNVNGVSITAEVFVGVEGGLTPSGELRWLPPDRRDPVAFAKISLDVAVSAGAGASAQLHIFYANGKFRVKASARLCWGVGAKGAVDFVVDAGGMVEFVKWVYYQLAHVGFKIVLYFERDAFQILSKVLFMVISEDGEIGRYLAEGFDNINQLYERVLMRLEKADARAKLVSAVKKKPEWLVYATPETRGMLLYAITRHYPETHTHDTPSVNLEGLDVQIHALPSHKEAVLNILAPVLIRSEWQNVMQHMTIDGAKRADAGKAEGDIIRFLDYGWSLNNKLDDIFGQINTNPGNEPKDVGNSYLQKYLAKRAKLMGEFPRGYDVVELMRIEEPQQLYALDGTIAPTFAMMDPPEKWRDDGTMLA